MSPQTLPLLIAAVLCLVGSVVLAVLYVRRSRAVTHGRHTGQAVPSVAAETPVDTSV